MKTQICFLIAPEIRAVIERWATEANINKNQVLEQLVMSKCPSHLWRDPETCELLFVNEPYNRFVQGKLQ
ncbi:MAG: hypothetical protein JRH18_08940 [Deltaproteobacteria bacterium]|nr:hypothetical protein [Deltaproteobacteria bacterium]MBW2151779.1 hypothetical protein [Deltaproteobacteria bacterium]